MIHASSQTVTRVLRGQLCTGCGLCASVSDGNIVMRSEGSDFPRPVQVGPIRREIEYKIASSCPGAIVSPWPSCPNRHPYWGPWRTVATGHALDESVRYRASSGGAVSALAIHALQTGVVDRVVHVIADPDAPTRNVMKVSSSVQEIVDGAGSRYSSSSALVSIDQILSDGGSVAFIGKPCDISALRQLGFVDQRVNLHVSLMLSFFCAGVPSYSAADRLVEALGAHPGNVVKFQYRGKGWPGDAVATLRDGEKLRMTYARSWGEFLSKDVQFRCKICPDAVGGTADISCADAWYGDDNGYPDFSERDGRSLIIARSILGQTLLESAVREGALMTESLSENAIDLMQPSQARRKRLVKSRSAALKLAFQPRIDDRGTMVEAASRRAGTLERIRSFLGMIRRILIRTSH